MSLTKKTWGVSHKVKFQKLKKIIENNQIKYNDKPVHLIATHKYLKVENKVNSQEYHTFWYNFSDNLKANVENGFIQKQQFYEEKEKGSNKKKKINNQSFV